MIEKFNRVLVLSGFGIERIAMGKYSIPDIRMLFENDVRFLSQL